MDKRIEQDIVNESLCDSYRAEEEISFQKYFDLYNEREGKFPMLPEKTKDIQVYALFVKKNKNKKGAEYTSLLGICRIPDVNSPDGFSWGAYKIQGYTKSIILNTLRNDNPPEALSYIKECNSYIDPRSDVMIYYLVQTPLMIIESQDQNKFVRFNYIKTVITPPSEEGQRKRRHEMGLIKSEYMGH